jgi:hypothetical protein
MRSCDGPLSSPTAPCACRPALSTPCSSVRSTKDLSSPASRLERGRQRRDYTLTQAGREALQAEAERLAQAGKTVTRSATRNRRGRAALMRERLTRAALRAVPPAIRSARRRDARHLSTRARRPLGSREVVDLVRSGLRMRGLRPRKPARGDSSPMDSAAVWLLTLFLAADETGSVGRSPASPGGCSRPGRLPCSALRSRWR